MKAASLFFGKSVTEKCLFLEACIWLFCASLLKTVVSFENLGFFLGTKNLESDREPDPREALVKSIGWAVEAGGRHLPWHPVCLSRAIAAKWMLRLRGIPATIYFGGRMIENRMWLHAWLRCGNRILTGGAERKQVEKICSYS